ncbi:hypothetical protein ABT298_32935, partial [Streptomyces sp. NPDC001034]|uniref:hypothetical protein n=1 Tax=Streptomyces sp. NPDC001034 TaxID=3154375 RepID=UPI003322B8F4
CRRGTPDRRVLPAGSNDVGPTSGSGLAPHPLAALFLDDGDGSGPQALTAEAPASADEVVDAELLDDPNPDDDEAENDVWDV